MGMFTNFSKTTHPDNRFEFLPKENVDEIIIGASCKHVFKIPFSYKSIVESGVVIYSQGVDTSFAIEITKDMVHEDYDESVIVVKLPVSKTLLFSEDKAGNSTKCQLKLLLKTDETYYDKPYKLKVFKPLDILTELSLPSISTRQVCSSIHLPSAILILAISLNNFFFIFQNC